MSRDDETVGDETAAGTVAGTVATATPSGGSGGRSSRPAIKAEGQKLGRYTIRKLLGRGGMGAVYEADDVELARKVALKVLREDREHPTEVLRREAQALARLVHQNVVMVYDVGVESDEVFLVMQLVEGMTIDAWIAKHHPPAERILALFEQAGLGLAAAHSAGLVHCDFKPTNVFVDDKGIARVGDFGLARAAKSQSVAPVVSLEPMSEMTTVAGTPAYMAPEQFGGVVAAASDQFAFCVALWECLAGERPYADSRVPALELEARGERRPLPRGAKVPRHVMKALERGLAKDPSDRFASMTALLEALKPPSRVALVATVAALTGLAAGGVVAYLVLARDDVQPWNAADVARSQPLTSYGKDACAYALTFEPGGRLVFDYTKGDIVDMYEQPIAGGAARQLTSAAETWEWRAQPGRRAGEVIHLVHDPHDPAKAYVAYLDLATGKATKIVDGMAWDSTVIGETVYYTPQRAGGIRAFAQGVDRPFLDPASQEGFFLLAASPKGDRLALSKTRANGAGGQPCVVDIATKTMTCFPYETVSRPVFSPDGTALYFGTYDGIVRHELVTGHSTLVVPGVYSEGVAVAPRGDWLVYSTCFAHTTLQKLATGEIVIASERVTYATESAQGVMAWVDDQRGVRVLMIRTADGQDRQITKASNGGVDAPAFSPDGRRIVFAASAPAPGLRIADLDNPGVITQVTADERDRAPVWTSNNLIAFTRGDENENEQAYVVTPDGHDLRKLADRTRTVYGVRRHELLVGGPDAMYWLDPVTGVERTGPKRPAGQLYTAIVSPSGEWVGYQMGPLGGEVWRVKGDGEPELLRTMTGSEYADSLIVRDSGDVLLILGRYYGDLVRVPARSGTRF